METNYPDVLLRSGGGGVGGGGGRRCRVVYSYAPQNEDELELQVNDEIEFLSEVEEGWWRGCVKGVTGVFPSNFVVEVPTSVDDHSLSEGEVSASLSSPEEQVPILPPKPIKEQCRVLFPYDAVIEDELTLKKDDIVTIISKDVEDKGWWKGELRGKIGLFPDNFVELLPQAEVTSVIQQKKPERPAKVSTEHPKIDSKIPLISAALPAKKPEADAKNNAQNETSAKRKSSDLGLIKPDTVASHRKSLEEKVANETPPAFGANKSTSPLRPPVSGKPKPAAAAKPLSVKRLSANDLVDGGISSKPANNRLKPMEPDKDPEELDLDSVERSDMLSNITASRPRAPGRRPPSISSNNIASTTKDNDRVKDPNILITNGNAENSEVEKSTKENKYEKHKPPFMEELKVNLKSAKPTVDNKLDVKKSSPIFPWTNKLGNQSGSDSSSTNINITSSHESSSKTVTSNIVDVRLSLSHRNETAHSKVLELSSVFADKSKSSALPTVDSSSHESASKKEVQELKDKVEKLAKVVTELVHQLREEADKRRILEIELNKLTDLVTQV